LVIIVFGLFWGIAIQRQTISRFKENVLKYQYIKMRRQANEENVYRLERQFEYGDSIRIIRKQLEKYEALVKEQAEKLEKVMQNSKEAEKILQAVELLKTNK